MWIKKVAETPINSMGNIVDSLNGESRENAPSINAVNNGLAGKYPLMDYSTTEQDTGMKSITGHEIYQRTFLFDPSQMYHVPESDIYRLTHGIENIETYIKYEGFYDYLPEGTTDPYSRGIVPFYPDIYLMGFDYGSPQYFEIYIDGAIVSHVTNCYVTIWYTKTV